MHAIDILSEALRNIRSGATRAGILTLVLVLGSTVLLGVDAAAIGSLQQRAQEVRGEGGAIRVLVADEAVDAAACAHLDRLTGIEAAGSVWEREPIQLLALPRVEVPFFHVSPGVARMLGFPSMRIGGIYIPETLAERWQIREGGRLETSSGTVTVEGVYVYSDDDGRDPRLANAIVSLGDFPDRASECWYSVWPPSAASDQYAYSAAAAAEGGASAPQIAPLNPSVGQRFNFTQEFMTRVTRLTTPAVVLLFGILAFSGSTRRRMEWAGNLHAGARRWDITATAAVEAFIWASTAAIATFFLTRLVSRVVLRESIADYDASLIATMTIAVAAAVVGAALPALITKEERLFSIFKSRT